MADERQALLFHLPCTSPQDSLFNPAAHVLLTDPCTMGLHSCRGGGAPFPNFQKDTRLVVDLGVEMADAGAGGDNF